MLLRIKITFLLLVLTQGIHSVEEYFGRLWEVFAPATFLSSLVSANPEKGFLVINIGLFIFGVVCWIICTGANDLRAQGLIWFWIVIETINGIGHPMWALYQKSYTPGLATAPILLLLALYLGKSVLASGKDY